MVHVGHRLLQVVVIFLAELHHSILAIKSLSDHFVCLDKLINLSSQLIVLMTDDSDMIVHRIDLHLEIGVVLEECTVRVSGALKLLPHVEQLVFLLPDLHF